MAEKIDGPSDTEFANAIVQNIPDHKTSVAKVVVATYLIGKVIKSAKRR